VTELLEADSGGARRVLTETYNYYASPPQPPGGEVDVQWGPEDHVRRRVMYVTLGIFGATVLIACVTGLWFDRPNADRVLSRATAEDRKLAQELEEAPFDHLKQVLQILLPAETALLGSATGFYFGAKARQP
jgi:hypothetical protein